MDDFVISCIDNLEDTDLLSYATLPDVVSFHYTVSEKSYLLVSFLGLVVANTNFQKFYFHLKAQILSLIKILFFPLGDRLT